MKTDIVRSINEYLNKYEFKGWKLADNVENNFSCIIVIPAIAEFENIKILISSLEQNDRKYFDDTLIIFVVNNLDSSPEEIKKDNFNTIELLRQYLTNGQLNIRYINASTQGNELPEKEGGVGLARKIGMDIALRYFNFEQKNNLLICLDADCKVSNNYFEKLHEYKNFEIQAGYLLFKHLDVYNEEITLAIKCYELFLNYYVAGLKFANSPYAFHTIGSTMVCSPLSYIKVQGMNKKKAAEDFYFMEKLAKITELTLIKDAYVFPSPRKSWRVPFGTGQRVSRHLSHIQNEYLLYDPKIFTILKEWVKLFYDNIIHSTEFYLQKAKEIDSKLLEFLNINKFKESWDKVLTNNNSQEQIYKQKIFWFDGFRTLKLVHFLRDNGYQNYDMFEVLDDFFDLAEIEKIKSQRIGIPSLQIQEQYLIRLENYIIEK